MILKAGSSGEIVTGLQKNLSIAGFYSGRADGIFGPETRQAVESLQRNCGLDIDGRAGPLTLNALNLLLPHIPRRGYRLSPNFEEWEFRCLCGCNTIRLNPALVVMLEKLRNKLGDRPVTISSGYRCPEHNRKAGGVKHSQHLLGNAADIVVAGVVPGLVASAAARLNFPGVGHYNHFTHVDVRPQGPARWGLRWD